MTRKDRLTLLVVAGVGLLIGFWMFVVSPQRKAASDARAQVETARTALESARARVTSGKQAQTQFRRDRATIVKIGRVVPETDDIPTLLTQLEAIGKKYDVYFIKYAPGANSGGGGGGSAPAAASSTPTDASAGGSSPSSSSSSPQGGVKSDANGSTDAVAPLYPPGSVEMTGGLGRTPITLGLRGTYFNLERYLRAVQRFAVLSQSGKNNRTNGRLLVIDGFSYKPSDLVFWLDADGKPKKTDRWLEAELAASVYFAPPLEAPAASGGGGAVGAAPPAAGAATPSTSTGTAAVGGLR